MNGQSTSMIGYVTKEDDGHFYMCTNAAAADRPVYQYTYYRIIETMTRSGSWFATPVSGDHARWDSAISAFADGEKVYRVEATNSKYEEIPASPPTVKRGTKVRWSNGFWQVKPRGADQWETIY
jgi:hypothetical protein